jgi:hypothetical protein
MQGGIEVVRTADAKHDADPARRGCISRIRTIRSERIRKRRDAGVRGKMSFEGQARSQNVLLLRRDIEPRKIGMRCGVISKIDTSSTHFRRFGPAQIQARVTLWGAHAGGLRYSVEQFAASLQSATFPRAIDNAGDGGVDARPKHPRRSRARRLAPCIQKPSELVDPNQRVFVDRIRYDKYSRRASMLAENRQCVLVYGPICIIEGDGQCTFRRARHDRF